MKKIRMKKLFLEELSKTPVVSAVCNKLNISRQTVYRWLKEDSEFESKYREHLEHGTENINDLAKSKVINQINGGDFRACKFWLENKDRSFIKPRLAEEIEEGIKKISIQVFHNKDEREKEKDSQEKTLPGD